MADKQKKGLKWKTVSLLAYLFATAVGYLYAMGYYGDFGIDILNYVEPIDFLLISLDNVDEMLMFSGLIVPFVLPLIILILAGGISFGLIVALASLATIPSIVLTLYGGGLLVLAVIAAVARRVADKIKWVGQTLRATFGRQQGTEGPPTFAEKIRRLGATYNEIAKAHPSEPTKEIHYLTSAKNVIPKVQKIWNWIPKILQPIRDRVLDWMRGFFESESSWRPKGWTSMGRLRQLVVVVILAYIGTAAYVNGEINAQTVRLRAESAASSGQSPPKEPNGWSIHLARSVICPIVPLVSCDPEARPVTTYAVPTANLASLELNECKRESVDNLKYARANLRQDVSDGAHRATSDCHVYLGATAGMQFLADFHDLTDEPTVPPVEPAGVHSFAVVFDARNGAVSTDVCDLKLAAVVGPFETGGVKVDRRKVGEQCSIVGHGKMETMSMESAGTRLGSLTSGALVLVGRADIRPINNVNFKSNMELVQRRVEWVQKSLKHRGLSVLSIAGGPMDSSKGDDPCSRIVEIYGCPANRPSASAGTTGAAGAGGRP